MACDFLWKVATNLETNVASNIKNMIVKMQIFFRFKPFSIKAKRTKVARV